MTIHNWSDLKEFGIICLTGEACGLGMRILCDLTPQGVKYMEEFLGGTIECRKGTNWNSSDNQVASIMLPYSILGDLAAFLILKRRQVAAKLKSGDVKGFTEDQKEYLQYYLDNNEVERTYGSWGTAKGGTRNTHVMSGRVE